MLKLMNYSMKMRNLFLLGFIQLFICIPIFGQSTSKSSLFFYPKEEIGEMWDTWMYYHNKTFYLYYLNRDDPKYGNLYNGIALSVSKDGINWEEKGVVLSKSDKTTGVGTGSIWKSENLKTKGKFIMNFSESYKSDTEDQQYIFFASSDDLVNWTRLEERFMPDSSFYKLNEGGKSRWDCIFSIPKSGGGRYGYWTASPKFVSPGFGFGTTSNGLDWTALPPPVIDWGDRTKMPEGIEVGAVEKINERYYMMVATYNRYDDEHVGMFTLESDSPEGPFRPAKKNFRLLTNPPGLSFTYFARFFSYKGKVLVDHQSYDYKDKIHFGLIKKAIVDKEGILRLGYWSGNEGLKDKKIKLEKIAINKSALISFLPETLNVNEGVILEGDFPSLKGNGKSALYIQCENNKGTAIFLKANGQIEFGKQSERDGTFIINETIDREMKFSSTPHFKLFLKQSQIELYIDNILVQCYTLPDKSTGRIGVVSKFAEIKNFSVWDVRILKEELP